MDKFFEGHILAKLTYITDWNYVQPYIYQENLVFTQKLFFKKSSMSDGIIGEIYQMFKKIIVTVLFKPFPKIQEKAALSNSILGGWHYYETKTEKGNTERQNDSQYLSSPYMEILLTETWQIKSSNA